MKILNVINKYNGSIIDSISLNETFEVLDKIEKSNKSFHEFKNSNIKTRVSLLEQMHDSLKSIKNELAEIIMKEAGKPISYARLEIERCLFTLKLAATESEYHKILSKTEDILTIDSSPQKTELRRFPRGPVLGLVPFNFPLNLAMHKIAPAIISGCSIVIKPNLLTPLSLLRLLKEWNTFLPKDLIQVALCDDENAQILVESDKFTNLSFTGSAKVGWKLKSLAGKKKVTLELGGDAALIIDQGYDWKSQLEQIISGSFLYSGQICISTQRIFIHDSMYEEFLKYFIQATKKIISGDPSQEDCVVGPIISKEHLERIDEWVLDAKQKGAQVHTGGKILSTEHSIYAPTILTNVGEGMILNVEEAFAPLVCLFAFKDFENVIEQVNKSKYGLQSGLMTNKQENIQKAFDLLEVGGLILNRVPGFRVDSMPYGGIKESGLGREGIRFAIDDFTEPKLLVF
tara:strand:+ start:59500 stop:60876 length:1377 start_codon:yes stop_codon:yes gene_type:complete